MINIYSMEIEDSTFYACVGAFVVILIALFVSYLYTSYEQFSKLANYAPAMTRDYSYYNNGPYLQNSTGYDSATRGYSDVLFAKEVAQGLNTN